ncbi:fibronectin type III domain-containing protein [Clostridium cellulovorans]|nr:fibronectin type III domain-containing protein [Clostridium cellulovorans]
MQKKVIHSNNLNRKLLLLPKTLLLLMFFGLLFSFIHSYDTYAVEPTIQWEKTILEGYTSSDMHPTSDGGFVITGSIPINGAPGTYSNVFVCKFNSLGNIEWTNNYGLETHDEWGNKIIQTKDGGYLILGSRSKSSFATYDPTTKQWIHDIIFDIPNTMYIAKLNSLGQLQWQQEVGYNLCVENTAIVETDDSGFLICGQEGGGFYCGPLYTNLLKLTSQGTVQFSKQLSQLFPVTSLNKTTDGGYILSGFNNGLFILKLDSSYNENWNSTITLSDEASYNYKTSVIETSTGFSVAGVGSNSILVSLDKSGQILWNKTYVNGNSYRANSVKGTIDSGYFFGVNTTPQGTVTNIALYKVDSNGDKQFEKQLTVNNEELSAVCPTKNDSYIVATNYSKNGKNSIHLMNLSCKPPTPNVKIVDTTDTSTMINIQDSNLENTLYQIKINNSYCTSKGSLTTEPTWISLDKKKVSIIGLLPNTSYNITAKARNVNGLESLNSASVTFTTLTTEAAAYKQQLLATTNAVIKAETSKMQIDLLRATSLVDLLPDSTDKTNLSNRLVAVQNSIDLNYATNAVVKAEATKQQIYVERALSLVDILPDSIDKVNLLNRLVLVQNTIDLANATNLVINAETTKQQIDIYIAINVVNDLPDSTDKTNLLNRLVSVQNNINNSTNLTIAINAVIMAETTKQQSDVSIAQSLVEGLKSETDKANLLNRLSLVQSAINLTSATNLVIKAEESKQQIDVVIAKNLVDVLPNSSDKTTLSNRLLSIQNSINDGITLDNAIKAVIKAEESNLQADVDRSKGLVEALPDSSDKTNLLDRLLVVQASIDNAIGAVEKAEETKLQEDVDKATALVNKLQSSEDKIKLKNRLVVIQNILDLNSVTNAVILAEESKGQLYVDKANSLVSKLQDSIDKLNLVKRLTIVQGYINLSNAQIAVAKAEASLQQADLDSAKTLAVALPISIDRSNLLNRLVNVQYSVNLANARTAVNIAEGSKLQANLDAAVNLVNALPSSSNKTDLLNRLVSLQNTINLANATNAVSKAEATNVQSDVDAAKELVVNLPASTGRTNLLNRLTVVQNKINLIIATNTVAKAEVTRLQADVDAAQNLVIQLPSSAEKTNLLNRLVNVQYKIDSANATNTVIKAEGSKQQADVDTAITLVNSLANSTTKTNLLNRLSSVQNMINLTNAIVKAEESKSQADMNLAQSYIDKLPSDDINRTIFQQRLALIKA